jgi:NAD(P)-dependent dehydrogenase (short-subunit alcohol dehydrogenase family)
MQLKGRVALVTGAGSGIGEGAAIRLARAGAKVACLDHTEEAAQKTAAKIRRKRGQAIALGADVSMPDQMQAAIRQINKAWRRLDIVFANAGINGVWAPLEELEPDEWDRTLRVNLKGTFLSVKYALPMLKKRGGSVIVTSSVNGTRIFSNTGATAYSCSKGAQVVFTKMVALELAKHRIRVNVICPGAIETNISQNTAQRPVEQEREPVKFERGSSIPLTRGAPGTPEQVAELVLFLASDASEHITGTPVWIDGGSTLL